MREPSNQQVTLVAMLLTTILAVTAMLCIAVTGNAQVGQPWDSSWDKPARSSTMRVDSTMSNFEVCQTAKRLKRAKTLTNKAKRDYCKPYRQELLLGAAFIALTTPTYPYYYTPNRVIIIR